MKVLIMPRYGRLGASSRLRLLQFIPCFQTHGLEITLQTFFHNDYVRNLYRGRIKVLSVLFSYMKRLWTMLQLGRYDVVVLEKEFLPWMPSFLELLLVPRKVKLVIDYDDAVFHRYDEHSSALVRFLLGKKIDALMKRADLVLAGNDYLAAHAQSAGCAWVETIPTVVDMQRYPAKAGATTREPLVIGWIGSPATAEYLLTVSAAVKKIQRDYPVRFVAIGARPDQLSGTPFEAVVWTEDGEVESLQSFDIGIMPLLDAPWERGKCGYKLIQYMACGLPVIASPIGVNCQIVEPGINGFLAQEMVDWEYAMRRLLENGEYRHRLGNAGREKSEKIYSVQAVGPRIVGLLKMLSDHGSKVLQ